MGSETDCSIFNRCSAPICPLCLNGGEIWLTDEPVCSKYNMGDKFPFIKVQRKLAKKHRESHDAGFFTVEMLNKITRVSRTTTGRDPDTPAKPSKFERKLLRKGGSGDTMPPDRIKTLRENLAAARLAKKRVLEEK
jgi:hypothetical protein